MYSNEIYIDTKKRKFYNVYFTKVWQRLTHVMYMYSKLKTSTPGLYGIH